LKLEGTICLLEHFIYSGSSHSTTDTHGNDTAFGIAAFQFMEQLSSQFGARAAQWMTQSNSAAVGVDVSRPITVFNADCAAGINGL